MMSEIAKKKAMSCGHCKTKRPYSPQAKKAGEAMIEVLRHYKDQLTVQDARDACTFCRRTPAEAARIATESPYLGR